LNEVITNPVPFDTTYGSPDFDLNMGGGFNHRASTLGHDPILGWIFGTMNIATSTVTLWTFNSYHVKTGFDALNRDKDKITNHANTGKIVQVSTDRLLNEGIEGKTVIGSSLIKEAIHLRSDINTKASLPLPIISVISPELARKLADFGLDMANVCDGLAARISKPQVCSPAKMWVEWSVGGVAYLAKRNPEPPTGGEAYTDLLYNVGAYSIVLFRVFIFYIYFY
jgi:hypothetical protein